MVKDKLLRADSVAQRLVRFDALMAAAQSEQLASGPIPQSWNTREELYAQVRRQRHPIPLSGKAAPARKQ
jgi:hypothetical protein